MPDATFGGGVFAHPMSSALASIAARKSCRIRYAAAFM
jgi:hypothetical protein